MKTSRRMLALAGAIMLSTAAASEEALSPKFRQALVDAHNAWRQDVKVADVNWADDLAAGAQQWADQLATERACRMEHSTIDQRQKSGENLYWASPVRWSDGKVERQSVTADQVVGSWGKERGDYDAQKNECRVGRVCGHYTQVVWRSTREVGCAMQVCGDQSQVWVCRYRPTGNWVGEKPY